MGVIVFFYVCDANNDFKGRNVAATKLLKPFPIIRKPIACVSVPYNLVALAEKLAAM